MGIAAKGILFDFDGVLADSMPMHLAGWREAYEEVFTDNLDEDTLNAQVGKSTKFIAKHLAKHGGKPLLADTLIQQKLSYLKSNAKLVRLFPGAKEVISELGNQQFPFGIVSNASRAFIKLVLAQHGLEVPFVHSIEDYRKPKPHPEPFLMGAKSLGLEFTNYSNIVVLEDSCHGLKAATDATMHGIGITSLHSEQELVSSGAKVSFDSVAKAFASGYITLDET